MSTHPYRLRTVTITLPICPLTADLIAHLTEAQKKAEGWLDVASTMQQEFGDHTGAEKGWRRIAKLYGAAAERLRHILPLTPAADTKPSERAIQHVLEIARWQPHG